MDKLDFIRKLRKGLDGIPDDDVNHWCEYYSEIIYDRIDEGMSEEEAVSTLGDPEVIVKDILSDVPIATLVKRKVKKNGTAHGFGIAAIIIGAVVWLPILVALIAVLFSLYITLWSLVVSVWATAISFFAASFGTLFISVRYLVETGVYEFMLTLGVTFVLVGVGIFSTLFSKLITKALVSLTKLCMRKLKLLFVGKEVAE